MPTPRLVDNLPDFFDDPARACANTDPDLFFAEGHSAEVETAKGICFACQFRRPCRDYAITHGEQYGVWGATTPRQRRQIRGQRAKAVAA